MNVKTTFKKSKFGTAVFSKILDAVYLAGEDIFEIRFANSIVYLIENSVIKSSNHIQGNPQIERVEIDTELGSGFYVYYADGQKAEASWAFVMEDAN